MAESKEKKKLCGREKLFASVDADGINDDILYRLQ
jgi:hypothetical protein